MLRSKHLNEEHFNWAVPLGKAIITVLLKTIVSELPFAFSPRSTRDQEKRFRGGGGRKNERGHLEAN